MDYQKKSFRSRPSNKNFLDNYDQTFRKPQNKPTESEKYPPTHRCKICGALWWFGTMPHGPEAWSLRSPKCGPCCDTMAMGDQIEPLNDSDS